MKLWSFTYMNHKGEKEFRRVQPKSIDFISNPTWGYQPRWLITGADVDKAAPRSFARARIVFTDEDHREIRSNVASVRFPI